MRALRRNQTDRRMMMQRNQMSPTSNNNLLWEEVGRAAAMAHQTVGPTHKAPMPLDQEFREFLYKTGSSASSFVSNIVNEGDDDGTALDSAASIESSRVIDLTYDNPKACATNPYERGVTIRQSPPHMVRFPSPEKLTIPRKRPFDADYEKNSICPPQRFFPPDYLRIPTSEGNPEALALQVLDTIVDQPKTANSTQLLPRPFPPHYQQKSRLDQPPDESIVLPVSMNSHFDRVTPPPAPPYRSLGGVSNRLLDGNNVLNSHAVTTTTAVGTTNHNENTTAAKYQHLVDPYKRDLMRTTMTMVTPHPTSPSLNNARTSHKKSEYTDMRMIASSIPTRKHSDEVMVITPSGEKVPRPILSMETTPDNEISRTQQQEQHQHQKHQQLKQQKQQQQQHPHHDNMVVYVDNKVNDNRYDDDDDELLISYLRTKRRLLESMRLTDETRKHIRNHLLWQPTSTLTTTTTTVGHHPDTATTTTITNVANKRSLQSFHPFETW